MADFINDDLSLEAIKSDLNPIGSADSTKYIQAADWNGHRQALLDIQTFLRGYFRLRKADGTNPIDVLVVAGAPAATAAKGSLAVDVTNARLYMNTDGATSWSQVGGSGGGGYSTWSAGTFAAGTMVKRGDYLFGCETTTSIDPCNDFGNLTDGASWNYNNVFDHSSSLGYATLINGATSTSSNMISKNSFTGWDKRRLVIDACINGTADAMGFGFYDSTATQTPTGSISGLTGAYGIEMDMFNSRINAITNGSNTGNVSVNSGFVSNTNDNQFERWYLDLIDNGAGAGTLTMNVYRHISPGLVAAIGTTPAKASADDIQFVSTHTITRPTWTSWRFVISARTGGSAGVFRAKRALGLYTGTEWSVLSRLPMRAQLT